MLKVYTTYLFAFVFLFNILTPALGSVFLLAVDSPDSEMILDIIDAETEETNQNGEKETSDPKEKEKFEDEKLRHLQAKFSLIYLKNSLMVTRFHHKHSYHNIVRSVPTQPPENKLA